MSVCTALQEDIVLISMKLAVFISRWSSCLACKIFIANLRCSIQCHDVTTMQYKSVLYGCIARMYSYAYGTFTKPKIVHSANGSTEFGKPTLDLHVALSASSK